MSNPILRLREASEALSPTERSVAAQIISDPSLVLDNIFCYGFAVFLIILL